eukprot:PhF_6_TR1377/c0_g1_i1/m.2396
MLSRQPHPHAPVYSFPTQVLSSWARMWFPPRVELRTPPYPARPTNAPQRDPRPECRWSSRKHEGGSTSDRSHPTDVPSPIPRPATTPNCVYRSTTTSTTAATNDDDPRRELGCPTDAANARESEHADVRDRPRIGSTHATNSTRNGESVIVVCDTNYDTFFLVSCFSKRFSLFFFFFFFFFF